MRNVKLLLQYDGAAYHGWQRQPNAVTIQEMIEDRIGVMTGERPAVIAASRTDAGVHALGQVASFRTPSSLSPPVFMRALNAMLPPDIRITDACDESEDFHPRFRAQRKVYFYLVSLSRNVSPFLQRYVWGVRHAVDVSAMGRALTQLQGRHDFSSFRASGCGSRSPLRTIYRAELEKLDGIDFMTARLPGNFIKITFEADAFLRHMVRNIVGTLVDIGRGERLPQEMEAIINACDRKAAGPTAPARGLFLEKICY